MIWTRRFRAPEADRRCSCPPGDIYGKIHRQSACQVYGRYFLPYDGNDLEWERHKWKFADCGKPKWEFPMIRKDYLEELLRRRGQSLYCDWTLDVPVWEFRGYQYSYYDLRIVARFAPRPQWPSMWRCRSCRQKMLRGEWQWRSRCGEVIWWVDHWQRPLECSPQCQKMFLQRQEKRRKKEWEGIVKSRKLIKTVRKLLKDPEFLAACRSPSGASKPVTTLPPS